MPARPLSRLPFVFFSAAIALIFALGLPAAGEKPQEQTVEQIAKTHREAVVIINGSGRTGEERGLGSGFVVRSDGLIATNFHVIGQGRRFTVKLADGRTFEPTDIIGYDRAKDLALVKIDAKGLPTLELGDSDSLRVGQPVLSIGNPLGYHHSVTDGIVSERREVEGREMIQVAMPIEPGSSGSPVIDLQGRAVGIIAIKVNTTTSLGFAVPINDLKSLIQKPHPLSIDRWLTIGALDPKQWQPLMGGTWRQRAGRITASGMGSGFGGRTLCLSQTSPPEGPFELAVDVRLGDESGAAGLVFHSDGGNKHYGFYPTGGALRLTRFEGPDVFSWTIINTVPSPHYRLGQWNTIHVRVDGPKITCSVNGEVVIEAEDNALAGGRVGFVKFRDPSAEFRHFRVGDQVPSGKISEEAATRILAAASKDDVASVDDLVAHRSAAMRVLRNRALELERQADRLRQLAKEVHRRATERELTALFEANEQDVDLLRATLLLAKLDNDELDTEPYVQMVDRMAREVEEQAGDVGDAEKLDLLIDYLFRESGFHGGDTEYYHRSNSYLNEVLDDREGLPITLSVVFLETARRLGLPVVGIPAPGHFLVEYRPDGGEGQLIDVFGGGKLITRADAAVLSGRAIEEEQFKPATKRQILLRMLGNLLSVADRERDAEGMLRYLDVILALNRDASREHWFRAVLRFQNNQPEEAAEDLDWLVEHQPANVEMRRVRELRELIRRQTGE